MKFHSQGKFELLRLVQVIAVCLGFLSCQSDNSQPKTSHKSSKTELSDTEHTGKQEKDMKARKQTQDHPLLIETMRKQIDVLEFSPDDSYLAAGYRHGMIDLFDVATRKKIRGVKAHVLDLKTLAFAPDGTKLVSGGMDRAVNIWSIPELKKVGGMVEKGIGVTSVRFSPQGDLAVGGFNASFIIRDPISLDPIMKFEQEGAVTLTFSPDGKLIAAGSALGEFAIWEVTTAKKIHAPKHLIASSLLSYSSKGEWLASLDGDTIRIFETAEGKEIKTFTLKGICRGLVSDPKGKWLAFGDGRVIRIVETPSWKTLAEFDTGKFMVWAIATDSGGKWLASTGTDYWEPATSKFAILLWDMEKF